MTYRVNKTNFLKDVKDHALNIIKDDGIYRHLRFSNPNEKWNQWFDIVTYPNHLVVSGDMGTWVFSRIEDMFNFFRSKSGNLEINTGYWEEKLQASDCTGGRDYGAKEFSHPCFENIVKDVFKIHCLHNEVKGAKKKELWEEIKYNVLSAETEEQAHTFARDFEHDGFEFHDFWEYDLKQYTNRYVWILFAVVWGIRKYDDTKNGL